MILIDIVVNDFSIKFNVVESLHIRNRLDENYYYLHIFLIFCDLPSFIVLCLYQPS